MILSAPPDDVKDRSSRAERLREGFTLQHMLRRSFLVLILGLPIFTADAQTETHTNIILITLENAGANRVSLEAKSATPHLAALAAQSIVFEHAYAQAPLTIVSLASLLTGTYPQTNHATELGGALPSAAPFLPALLHADGYHTAAFIGSSLLDARDGFAPGFAPGFDTYDAPSAAASAGGFLWRERSPAEVASAAIRWLAQVPEPSFAWISLAGDTGRSTSAQDQALGLLLTALRGHTGEGQPLIVVTADHGQSDGAHGEKGHGIFLYDETIHVPLLIKLPRGELAGTRVPARVRLIDIAPSILEAAHLAIPPQMQGASLLRAAKAAPGTDQPAYARSDLPEQAFGWSPLESLRMGKYLYIRAPQQELYDSAVDAGALHNLATTSPAILQVVSSQMEAFDRRLRTAGPEPAQTNLSHSDMDKLASLGYVGLQRPAVPASGPPTGIDPKARINTANVLLAAWRRVHEAGSGWTAAAAALEKLPPEDQKGFLAEWTLGTSFARNHQYAPAIDHLHAAIQLRPDIAWPHVEIAEALIKTGDRKTAQVHLEIAHHLLPDSLTIKTLLAAARGQASTAQ
jgi:arylsulfatase A-like enzyme